MGIKQIRLAALVFLVSGAVGLASAAATNAATKHEGENLHAAISQQRAETNMRIYTFVRAACSSSYWECTNFFGPRCSLTGHNSRGLAQWACTEFVFRQKRHHQHWWQSSHSQACGVSASWDPYGEQTHGFIKCQYTVENSKDHRWVRAITKSHAESITRAYAWSRAACGGYWACTSFFGPYCQDTAHNQMGEAQWVCSTTIFRSKRHHKFWESAHGQACLVELHLDPYAHPTYGHIRCQYTVDNSRDRTRR